MRSIRELQTLQVAMDSLLDGDLGVVGDVLMQWFKALEGSLIDGGWELSRHLELIPPRAVSTATAEERERAGRLAAREATLAANLTELRQQVKKVSGNRQADESGGPY